jgi:SsrA-binding protein
MAAKSSTIISTGRVAENRKARHDYEITETIEAGLVLLGSEVKSLRRGRASIVESYAAEEGGRLMLVNANIPE